MNYKLLLIVLLILSCTKKDESQIKTDKKYLSIVFSHNINGETYPCGCRKFPLGGLEQVAGLFHQIEKESEIFYVDTGDMLYQSAIVPASQKLSQDYTASKLVDAMNILGLKLMTPGDQEFSQGIGKFKTYTQDRDFSFLISHAKEKFPFDYIPHYYLKVNAQEFVFLGATWPPQDRAGLKNYLYDPADDLPRKVKELKTKYPKAKFILMSHQGFDADKSFAESFNKFDWIIGAHSLSFFQTSYDVGQTKIVQGLSRNHYIGEIKIDLSTGKSSYKLHDVRDELKDLIKPNPFTGWVKEHKEELLKIQEKEQGQLVATGKELAPQPTYTNCMECHTKQVTFWQGTAHSLAFITLHKNQEHKNESCIGCHSLAFKEKDGFNKIDEMVLFDNEADTKKYWAEFATIFKDAGEIREMKPAKRRELSSKWAKHDEKFGVNRQFANVQCLHCHNQSNDHPFDLEEVNQKVNESTCLTCHTADQSPEIYPEGKLDRRKLQEMLKKVTCPKGD
jgi:hypothetical protein